MSQQEIQFTIKTFKQAITDTSQELFERLLETGILTKIEIPEIILKYCIRKGSSEKLAILLEIMQIQKFSGELYFQLIRRACNEVCDDPQSPLALEWKGLARDLLHFAADVNLVKTQKLSFGEKTRVDIITPLKCSIRMKDVVLTQRLIDRGAPINMRYDDDSVQEGNLLHLVCNMNHFTSELAACLIKNGIETDLKDRNGNTPLSLAAKNGNLALMQLLFDSGISKDQKTGNNNAHTLLMDCIANENYKVANFLIDSGADIHYQDQLGCTAGRLAFDRKNRELGEKLIGKGARLSPYIGLSATPDGLGGIRVDFMDEFGSAKEAGIRVGDIVTAVDHIEVNSMLKLSNILAKHRPLDKILLSIKRQGELVMLWVEIQTR